MFLVLSAEKLFYNMISPCGSCDQTMTFNFKLHAFRSSHVFCCVGSFTNFVLAIGGVIWFSFVIKPEVYK